MRIEYAAVALACALAVPAACAQSYPSRPLRVLVPAQAGGAADVVARKLGVKMTEVWRQQVVIDNRIGVVGVEIAARAAADGYTLMFTPDSLILREAVYEAPPYRTLRDFAPVTLAVLQPQLMVVQPSLPARTVQEFIALARTKPGQLNYGSAGNGTVQHLAGELLNTMARIKLVHVPYKGVPQAVTDVIGGHVQCTFGSPVGVLPHVRENRLRLLAVTSSQRSATLPEVPTIAESGVPGYGFTGWLGMFAPRATSRAVIDQVQREIARIVHDADVRQLLAVSGTEPLANTPDQFEASLKTEIARWTKVAREAGIKVD
jgi:tripartite-type tricarboxylate transporter receptor subunit TctC